MNTVIIRTCERDEFIARLCYKSFKHFMPNNRFVFFKEEGCGYYEIFELKNREKDLRIINRQKADNLGGRSNVVKFVNDLKKIEVNEGYAIICDSDILIRQKFDHLLNGDLCGVVSAERDWHVSGQMQIIKHNLYNELLKQDIYGLCSEVLSQGLDVADDTTISWFAKKKGYKIQALNNYWIHEKLYYLI